MKPLIRTTLTLLLSTFLSSQLSSGDSLEKCRYFGEPHLIPFPTTSGGPQKQYVCHPNSSEILLGNNYISISVTTSSTGNYPITAYTVKVPGFGGLSACIVSDSATGYFATSCTGSSAVTVSIAGSTIYIVHATQPIKVIIDKQNLKGGYFDITIFQTFALVQKSSGTCVKYKCMLETLVPGRKKRQESYPAVITKICDSAIDGAVQQYQSPIDKNSVSSAKVACLYDVGSVLDQLYVRSAIIALVRGDQQPSDNNDEYTAYLSKVSGISLLVFCDTVPLMNEQIAGSKRVCKENGGQSQCLQTNDYIDLCPGERRK